MTPGRWTNVMRTPIVLHKYMVKKATSSSRIRDKTMKKKWTGAPTYTLVSMETDINNKTLYFSSGTYCMNLKMLCTHFRRISV